MTSAQTDLDALLAGTSFSTQAERDLAARESLTRARALRLRVEPETLPKAPRRPASTQSPAIEKTKTSSIPITADEINLVLDAVSPLQAGDQVHITVTTLSGGEGKLPEGPWKKTRAMMSASEVRELKRWLTHARRKDNKIIQRVRDLAGRTRTGRIQAEQFLRLRDQRLTLCKHLLDLYEVAPTQRACLVIVAKAIQMSDCSLDKRAPDKETRPLLLPSRDNDRLRQQNALLERVVNAANASSGVTDTRLTTLAQAFVSACGLRANEAHKYTENGKPFIQTYGVTETEIEIEIGADGTCGKELFYNNDISIDGAVEGDINKGFPYKKAPGAAPMPDRSHPAT